VSFQQTTEIEVKEFAELYLEVMQVKMHVTPVRNSSKLQSEKLLWGIMKMEVRGVEDTL
jgi:hypothetical protein